MPPTTTLWPLDDHTRGKNMVLKAYMNAWLPIILSTFERAMFVDAFAGPGEYKNGDPGSPVIALNALAQHSSRHMMMGQIDYVFIEKNRKRFDHLNKVIARQRKKDAVPSFCNIRTCKGAFAQVLPRFIESNDLQRIPIFVMIDPFGVSEAGMENIEALMKYPRAEVYVSLMYEWINRFKRDPVFEAHLDDLFGCRDWQQGKDIPDSKERKEFFYELYRKRLKLSGARHVLNLELYDGNRLKYALFFATQSDLGCDKMKQAMWKAEPTGGYSFRGDRLGQLSFEPTDFHFSELERALISEFGMNEPVAIELLQEFMRSDRVLFHSGQLKGHLADMEHKSALIVEQQPTRKQATFPPGTILRFVEPPPPSPRQQRLM